jgi:glucose/mannose-6-phosphate isomerase
MQDEFDKLLKLDTGKVAESICLIPDQVEQLIDEAEKIKVPKIYSKVTEVVVCGMGGSNIGAGIIKSLFHDELRIPIIINAGYGVPNFLDSDTLCILSSCSGNTEETLSAVELARKRKAKLFILTANVDGKLAGLMKNKISGYIVDPRSNPSSLPNYGSGYALAGIMVVLHKAGIIKIDFKELRRIIENLKQANLKYSIKSPVSNNPAKMLAKRIAGKQLVIVGAEFLYGNLRLLRNQICENGKNFATFIPLPEINHYAMESLVNPKNLGKNLQFLFIDSGYYHPRVKRRSELTKEVVKKNGIGYQEWKLKGNSQMEQVFELLQFGSWLSYYTALANKANPCEIKWVDYFKKKLG